MRVAQPHLGKTVIGVDGVRIFGATAVVAKFEPRRAVGREVERAAHAPLQCLRLRGAGGDLVRGRVGLAGDAIILAAQGAHIAFDHRAVPDQLAGIDVAGLDRADDAELAARHTGQQQADGGEDLAKRLHEETPERVEFLLGVRHALNLALSIVDSLGDGASEL